MEKLLQITRATGIETRASVIDFKSGFACQPDPPTISDMDDFFRQKGVELTAQACRSAIEEWGGEPSAITHTIGVTCTNYGLPGYDLLVAQKLELPHTVERVLLQGVGCAGGLAIMRVAAQIALAAAARGKPACVLAYACELCMPNGRHDLAEAEACTDPDRVGISGALFSDGAAAFVLCNDYGLSAVANNGPIFQLHEWANATIPNTGGHMGFYPESMGYRSNLSREIPNLTAESIEPLFSQLLPSFRSELQLPELEVGDLDWALHPGGKAIINKVQDKFSLTDDQLRATRYIYKTRGNSSSPSVLIVLDYLREMGNGKDHVAAVSFGPGLATEVAFLTRCRDEAAAQD